MKSALRAPDSHIAVVLVTEHFSVATLLASESELRLFDFFKPLHIYEKIKQKIYELLEI